MTTTNPFNDIPEISETDAWHQYKDAAEKIDAHRVWALRALEEIKDVSVFVAAKRAIDDAFDKAEAHHKARYTHYTERKAL